MTVSCEMVRHAGYHISQIAMSEGGRPWPRTEDIVSGRLCALSLGSLGCGSKQKHRVGAPARRGLALLWPGNSLENVTRALQRGENGPAD